MGAATLTAAQVTELRAQLALSTKASKPLRAWHSAKWHPDGYLGEFSFNLELPTFRVNRTYHIRKLAFGLFHVTATVDRMVCKAAKWEECRWRVTTFRYGKSEKWASGGPKEKGRMKPLESQAKLIAKAHKPALPVSKKTGKPMTLLELRPPPPLPHLFKVDYKVLKDPNAQEKLLAFMHLPANVGFKAPPPSVKATVRQPDFLPGTPRRQLGKSLKLDDATMRKVLRLSYVEPPAGVVSELKGSVSLPSASYSHEVFRVTQALRRDGKIIHQRETTWLRVGRGKHASHAEMTQILDKFRCGAAATLCRTVRYWFNRDGMWNANILHCSDHPKSAK